MSIEQTLERIAVALEMLAKAKSSGEATIITAPGGPLVAPAPDHKPSWAPQAPVAMSSGPTPPTPVAPAPVMQPVAPTPVGGPPVGGPPPVAMPQIQTPPAVSPPPQQVSATDTLDQIRDAANSFNRAHPERAGEVWSIITRCGGDTNGGLASIPAQNHAAALQQIQALEA